MPEDMSAAELASAPVPVTVIGTIEKQPGLRAALAGNPVELPPAFDHFA